MAERTNALIRLGLRSVTAAFFFLAAGVLLSRFVVTAEWAETTGTVESLRIVSAGGTDDSRSPGERFRPAASYRYTIDGEEHTGARIAVYPWIFRNEERVAEYLERNDISRGRRVPVYYNPDDPSQALLVRDIPWGRVEVLGAILFLVLLPTAVVVTSVVEFVRGGGRRKNDKSRGRFW